MLNSVLVTNFIPLDPLNSYIVKQDNGYLIVARDISGDNITTGGDILLKTKKHT